MSQQLQLLKSLMYIRLVEENIVKYYSEQEMRCPVHLSIGQEAAAVGTCYNLTKEDKIFTGHRSHAHYLAKGGNLKRFFAEIYGKITGCSQGRGGSMHLTDEKIGFIGSTPIVGGIIPLAVGAAFTKKYLRQKGITVAFLGDGATEEGVFHESMNFAKLHNLPVLFVVENNLYSVYTPLHERQPKRAITSIAKAHGLATHTIKGNDVEEITLEVGKVILNIKKNQGPALIEIFTYRKREHCGPNIDDQLGYRPAEEVKSWSLQDPLNIHIKKMLKKKVITKKEIQKIKQIYEKKIEQAIIQAKKDPFPKKTELNKHIYA